MSASNNFINKPVLSTVCSLLIVIVGLIAIPILPIENLPDIALPTVKVQATYVSADAQSQPSLGLMVFGGLLVATFLSTLVVPVFYVVMKTLIGDSKSKTGEGTSGVMS